MELVGSEVLSDLERGDGVRAVLNPRLMKLDSPNDHDPIGLDCDSNKPIGWSCHAKHMICFVNGN